MSRSVIQAMGFANGNHCPHAGQYLKSFDHEAHAGRGFGDFTPFKEQAMTFESKAAAFQFWKRVPVCKPIREDGQPNRPFTAITVVVEDAL